LKSENYNASSYYLIGTLFFQQPLILKLTTANSADLDENMKKLNQKAILSLIGHSQNTNAKNLLANYCT
jgi:hypothetical protein